MSRSLCAAISAKAWRAAVLAWLLLWLGAALAAEEAGRFLHVLGDVQVIAPGGLSRDAAKGGKVFVGDTVKTGLDGWAQLLMKDEAQIALRQDSTVRFDAYMFSGRDDGKERSLLGLVKGGFRTLTGLIGKNLRNEYRVTTPTATIGIRGTDHEPVYVPADEGWSGAPGADPGTYDRVHSGATFIENEAGRVELGPNQVGFVPPRVDVPPARLDRIPDFMRSGGMGARPGPPKGGDRGGQPQRGGGPREGGQGQPGEGGQGQPRDGAQGQPREQSGGPRQGQPGGPQGPAPQGDSQGQPGQPGQPGSGAQGPAPQGQAGTQGQPGVSQGQQPQGYVQPMGTPQTQQNIIGGAQQGPAGPAPTGTTQLNTPTGGALLPLMSPQLPGGSISPSPGGVLQPIQSVPTRINFQEQPTNAPIGYVLVAGDKSGAFIGSGAGRVGNGGSMAVLLAGDSNPVAITDGDSFRYLRGTAAQLEVGQTLVDGVPVRWGIYAGGSIFDARGERSVDVFHFTGAGQALPAAVVEGFSGRYSNVVGFTRPVTESGLGPTPGTVSTDIVINNGTLTTLRLSVTDSLSRNWTASNVTTPRLADFIASGGVSMTGNGAGGTLGPSSMVSGGPIGPNGGGFIGSYSFINNAQKGVTGSFVAR